MRGRFVIFLVIVTVAMACEDPNTLTVSRVFSGNNLQTIYSDTFSVFTSTVQLDTFLTNNTKTMLIGRYNDDRLGQVSSSTYFQIGPANSFIPDFRSNFDSLVMVFHYNHTFSGDSTKPLKINGYRLTEQMVIRKQPYGSIKLSAFNYADGFFSSSSFSQAPDTLFSGTIKKLYPHTDSVSLRMPDKLGALWFRLAQLDSGHIFSNPGIFVNTFFNGLHLEADASTQSCVVGFDVEKFKVRMYYKKFVNNLLRQTHQDFNVYSSLYQFNNIKYDRTGTILSALQPYKGISSVLTNDVTYVQAGTGLVTRLDFPSVKSFFANQPNVILNAAYLVVSPEQGTYPKNTLPPKQLQLYATDATNIPLSSIPGGAAAISYDYQYGQNTNYTFQIYSFLFGQIKSGTNFITPLFLTPGGNLGDNIQRLYLGDRVHPNTKIQLKIYYSYAQN